MARGEESGWNSERGGKGSVRRGGEKGNGRIGEAKREKERKREQRARFALNRAELDGRKDPGAGVLPANRGSRTLRGLKALTRVSSHARQTHKTLYIPARSLFERSPPGQAIYADFSKPARKGIIKAHGEPAGATERGYRGCQRTLLPT